MSSSIFTGFAEQICGDRLKAVIDQKPNGVTLIGIDGPTAVGKTIFADAVAQNLRTVYGRKCWIYRLDWHLAERKKRTDDLSHLFSQNVPFPFEGELHMHLQRFGDFLKKVRTGSSEKIILKHLYSRKNGGTLTGEEECLLEPGLVILIEGHYTLRTEFSNLIDLNILMLGDKNELLARKIARVKGYRETGAAEDYFWRVDLPSFRHHLERFGTHAQLLVDNTDYTRPKIRDISYVDQWLQDNRSPAVFSRRGDCHTAADMAEKILSGSLMVGDHFKTALKASLEFVFEWDRHVGEYLRVTAEDIDVDLTSLSQKWITDLNERFAEKSHSFFLRHTNALYNVYNRSLPISIGIGIEGQNGAKILVDVYHGFLKIQVAWAGGYSLFQVERKLGEISNSRNGYTIRDITPGSMAKRDRTLPVKVITPTPLAIPSFLRDLPREEVFSGHEVENLSASQALAELAEGGGVWIHRFAKFSELNFFADIIRNSGGNTAKAGNYLIAVWSKDAGLLERFRSFRDAWEAGMIEEGLRSEDEAMLDRLIDEEREDLGRFVKKHCPDFSVLDGYLHSPAATRDLNAWRALLEQIDILLSKGSRLVRKRTVQFIQRYFPDLSLSVAKLWDDVPAGSLSHISLDALTSISPSILAELYLLLALRDEPAAVLGANIYDIRKHSADCFAYLQAAANKETAIVLQGSLNALGQKEEDDGKSMEGYLKPDQGPLDLVAAGLNAARDMVLTEGKMPPLFGIGLDHVDAGNDRPKGRAKRFLKTALASESVTHFVLDGSPLFHAEEETEEGLKRAFDPVVDFAVDLLDHESQTYIYDKEVCTGELNYIGKSKRAMIPTAKQMELFAKLFQRKMRLAGLGGSNARPSLFVGNLGTTHHGADNGEIFVEKAREWREQTQKYNFVSAVLHGTTGTHPQILAKASKGCHKVNVAGDFLHTLVKSLPERLQRPFQDGEQEPKRRLHAVRKEMDRMSAKETQYLKESLQAHCRLVLDNINAPKLTPLDIRYLRYKNYKFTPRQIRVIRDEITKKIEEYSLHPSAEPSDNRVGYQFSASMIEVPFDENYKELTQKLWEEGVRYFHIDVGDGKFIPRQFSGLEKARYLRETFPKAILHCHLMVENPDSIIEQYVQAGCNTIAIHRRAFTQEKCFFEALKTIRKLGSRPGLIIETSESLDVDLKSLIEETKLDWVVVMGVPVGYGGQIFDMTTLKRIGWLRQMAREMKTPFLIEVDGGLTMENLLLCRKSGAQIFAGWSIVNASTQDGVCQKVRRIREILS